MCLCVCVYWLIECMYLHPSVQVCSWDQSKVSGIERFPDVRIGNNVNTSTIQTIGKLPISKQ